MENGYTCTVYTLSGLTPYEQAWQLQKNWVKEIDQGERENSLLLLEHPHVYTLGRAGHEENLLISHHERERRGISFVRVDRGGDITYHGPGQLVGYLLFQLEMVGNDPHLFLRKIEEGLILFLKPYGIMGERKEGYTGVWVGDEKIAAIGVKLNKRRGGKGYISSHGFALNLTPDLSMFQMIHPCGITRYGVTSMEKLTGVPVSFSEVYSPLVNALSEVFQLNVQGISPLDIDEAQQRWENRGEEE